MTQKRWTQRPVGSTWGDFGADDSLGRLNLITPKKVRQGVSEVHDGVSYCLSLPLELPGGLALNPNRHPPVVRPNLRDGDVNMNFLASDLGEGATDILSDDLVILHTQYSTQWDSLAHVGAEFDVDGSGKVAPVYYNGFRAGVDVTGPDNVSDAGIPTEEAEARTTSSAGVLGVDGMARTCIQGRGVMIDLAHHLGPDRHLVGFRQLEEILQQDGCIIEQGDIVLFHTGFAERLLTMDGHPNPEQLAQTGAVLDGRDAELLAWITDTGIAAIAADNYAVEMYPARRVDHPAPLLPLHEHCLFRLGLPLGELWYLTELAEALRDRGRIRFLLTAPPLRLPGAVGSPLTPVATI